MAPTMSEPMTDGDLARWTHLAQKSLAGGVGLSHDEAHKLLLMLIEEVQRLRSPQTELTDQLAELRATTQATLREAIELEAYIKGWNDSRRRRWWRGWGLH
jgi:hypothetical protein